MAKKTIVTNRKNTLFFPLVMSESFGVQKWKYIVILKAKSIRNQASPLTGFLITFQICRNPTIPNGSTAKVLIKSVTNLWFCPDQGHCAQYILGAM